MGWVQRLSTAPPIDFRLGHLRQILGDRYEFKAFLGRGAFASVYLVKNLRLGRSEALKVLAETHETTGEFGKRFVEEAMLVASLDHPNIVKVYDYGQSDGIIWYSMQLIDGPTLRSELAARQRMDSKRVVQLAIPLLDALEYSHQRGIIHRDIKPSNILLDSRGRPYVMDFGIAKSAESAMETMTGSVLGTPTYISPEQMSGQKVDGRADMYSLGIALYELLAGLPPFHGPEPLVIMLQRMQKDAESLRIRFPELDADLDTIILKSLARDPDARFADAAEMRQALIDRFGAMEGEPQYRVRAEAPKQQRLAEMPPPGASAPSIDAAADAANITAATVIMTDQRESVDAESTGTGSTGTEAAGTEAAGADSVDTDDGPTPSPQGKRPMAWVAAAVLVCVIAGFGWMWTRPTDSDTVLEPPVASEPAGVSETTAPEEPQTSVDTDDGESDTEGPDATAEGTDTNAEGPDTTASTVEQQPEPASPPEQSQPTRTPPAQAAPPPVVAPPSLAAPPPVVRRAVKPARILETPLTELSPEDATRCEGTSAVVSIRVGEDGRAESAKVLTADIDSCKSVAESLALGSVFAPAEDADGQPVASTITISLNLAFAG